MLSAVILATGALSCDSAKDEAAPPKAVRSVLDQQITLQPEEIRTWSFEVRAPESEMKVEAAHLSGEPMHLYVLDKSDFNDYEAKRDWAYLTRLSIAELDNAFDSDWQQLARPGVYSVIVRPHNSHEPQPTVANLRVMTR